MGSAGSVRVTFTKWGDRPHWRYTASLLGRDEHGSWLGVPVGTRIVRPGATVVSRQPQVVLVPAAPWVAIFYRPDGEAPHDVYVDITTPPSWDGDTVHAVDLDLDVLRGWDGRVRVDDEDEFAAHRVAYGYPADVVQRAVSSCEDVRSRLVDRSPPFDGATSERWLARLGDGA